MLRRTFLKAVALLLAPFAPAAAARLRPAPRITRIVIHPTRKVIRASSGGLRLADEAAGYVKLDRPYEEITPEEMKGLLGPAMAEHAARCGWKGVVMCWASPPAGRVVRFHWLDVGGPA